MAQRNRSHLDIIDFLHKTSDIHSDLPYFYLKALIEMDTQSLIEKCSPTHCESWSCIFNNYNQTLTFAAAAIGVALCILIVVRFWKADVAHVGLGLAGMLAMGVLLLSLPSVTKISLSFAAQQSVLLEFKSGSSANDVCTMNNLITVANKPLIERISLLETSLKNISKASPGSSDDRPEKPVSSVDVRIYYRDGRREDAKKLLSALRTGFPVVTDENSDLTEVGQDHPAGFNRVRYEAGQSGNFSRDAITIKDEASAVLKSPVNGPDAVRKALPGDIQILLY